MCAASSSAATATSDAGSLNAAQLRHTRRTSSKAKPASGYAPRCALASTVPRSIGVCAGGQKHIISMGTDGVGYQRNFITTCNLEQVYCWHFVTASMIQRQQNLRVLDQQLSPDSVS